MLTPSTSINVASLGWLLLLWLLIPLNYLYVSNMLEGTLTLFTSLASLLLLFNTTRIHSWLLTASLSTAAMMIAFLCNGPSAFFPMIIPCLKACISHEKSYRQGIMQSLMLMGMLSVSFLIFYTVVPAAWTNTQHYLHEQLTTTLNGTRGTRYAGIAHLHIMMLYIRAYWLISLITLLIVMSTKKHLHDAFNNRTGLLLLALSLISSLPVGISPRQAFNYIMPSAPFMTLAAMVFTYPTINRFMQHLSTQRRLQNALIVISSAMLGCALMSVLVHNSRLQPNPMLHDIQHLIHDLPAQSIVSVKPELFYAWYTGAYLARFSSISITPKLGERYYLTLKTDPLPPQYRIIKPTRYHYYQLAQQVITNDHESVKINS